MFLIGQLVIMLIFKVVANGAKIIVLEDKTDLALIESGNITHVHVYYPTCTGYLALEDITEIVVGENKNYEPFLIEICLRNRKNDLILYSASDPDLKAYSLLKELLKNYWESRRGITYIDGFFGYLPVRLLESGNVTHIAIEEGSATYPSHYPMAIKDIMDVYVAVDPRTKNPSVYVNTYDGSTILQYQYAPNYDLVMKAITSYWRARAWPETWLGEGPEVTITFD